MSLFGPECSSRSDVIINYYSECPVEIQMYGGRRLNMYDGFMVNCLLDSPLLGRGKATGNFVNWDRHGKHLSFTANVMIFDDLPQYPKHVLRKTKMVNRTDDKVSILKNAERVMVFVNGRGVGGEFNTMEFRVFPDGKSTYVNEAFDSFVSKWLQITSIAEVRKQFMVYLRREIGLGKVLNRPFNEDDYEEEPLDNVHDLGGGNVIIPYELKESLNRHLTMKVLSGVPKSFNQTRVYEGGFVLKAGRAGIRLDDGVYLPFGTELRYGFYVVDYQNDQPVVISFKDAFPRIPNSQVHSPFLQYAVHPDIPDIEGRCTGIGVVEPIKEKARNDIRFTCIWTTFDTNK